MKECLIKGCTNKVSEGFLSGDLCLPCHRKAIEENKNIAILNSIIDELEDYSGLRFDRETGEIIVSRGIIARFICDSCEDYEEIDLKDFRKGMHCECGGHLHLKKFDHYEKMKINAGTVKIMALSYVSHVSTIRRVNINGGVMTKLEFLRGVLRRLNVSDGTLRLGQCCFIYMAETHPEYAKTVIGTVIDPYYDDTKIIEFFDNSPLET